MREKTLINLVEFFFSALSCGLKCISIGSPYIESEKAGRFTIFGVSDFDVEVKKRKIGARKSGT